MSSPACLFADLLPLQGEHCSAPKHAAELFQRSKSLSCVQTVKLYFAGAVFASSNAALMLAQLGDEEAAVKEMQRIAR